MSKITLRAKDGTQITGELVDESWGTFYVRLAKDVADSGFDKGEWTRVHELPTKVGTVFRATVRGVENVRLMVADDAEFHDAPFISGGRVISGGRAKGYIWHKGSDIEASTVVIELEGDGDD